MTPAGFPHSDTHGSLPAFGYPWLFADRCVLLRLPVPRHPPCALLSLTCQQFLHCCLCQSCSNHFSLGSHFFSLTHLAVQCVGVFVLPFWLHILFVSSLFSFQGTAARAISLTLCTSALCTLLLPLQVLAFVGFLRRQPVVGSSGLEPPTSRLSGVRSNHLSYEPMSVAVRGPAIPAYLCVGYSCFIVVRELPFCVPALFCSLNTAYCVRELKPAQPVVEMNRIELSTPCLQGRCSPS